MADHKMRFESMIFNYETTGKTDLRYGEIKPIIATKYKEKSVCVGIRPPPLKYIHTFTSWKNPVIPIDLYWKPKDIVRTNPRHIQKEYEYLPDSEKEQVRKARPRLVMTPAVRVDDMEDHELRNRLMTDVYTTTATRAMRKGIDLPISARMNVSRPKLPAPANSISIPKLQVPYVSTEWRRDSVGWDSRQLRTHSDPTKEFWLAEVPKCEECKRTVACNELKRIKLRSN